MSPKFFLLIAIFLVSLIIGLFINAGILFWLKRVFKLPNPTYKNSIKVLVFTCLFGGLTFILVALVIATILYLINFKSATMEAALSTATFLTPIITFFAFHFFLNKRYQNNRKKSL
ncbi:MAG: hypothetical protein ABH896_00650, partial [Candidatus Jacksonbacteria bacterium]